MPKGVPNKRYTRKLKQMVVETRMGEKISCKKAARRLDVSGDTQVASTGVGRKAERACRLYYTDHKPFQLLEQFVLEIFV